MDQEQGIGGSRFGWLQRRENGAWKASIYLLVDSCTSLGKGYWKALGKLGNDAVVSKNKEGR